MDLPVWVDVITIAGGVLGFISFSFGISDYVKTHIKDENKIKLKKCVPLTYNECFNVDEPELINKHDFAKIYGLIYHLLQFKENGNRFNGLYTKWLFWRVYRQAVIINATFDNFTGFNFVHGGTGEHAIAAYKERSEQIVKLGKTYKTFYRHVNGYLSSHDDEIAEYVE